MWDAVTVLSTVAGMLAIAWLQNRWSERRAGQVQDRADQTSHGVLLRSLRQEQLAIVNEFLNGVIVRADRLRTLYLTEPGSPISITDETNANLRRLSIDATVAVEVLGEQERMSEQVDNVNKQLIALERLYANKESSSQFSDKMLSLIDSVAKAKRLLVDAASAALPE